MAHVTYLVYDGDCGFCERCASWCVERWGTDVIAVRGTDFLAQCDRLSLDEVVSSVWWVEPRARYRGAAAGARALAATTSPWRVIGLIAMRRPLPWLAEPLYRLVARYRHRLPGALACRSSSR